MLWASEAFDISGGDGGTSEFYKPLNLFTNMTSNKGKINQSGYYA